MELMNNNILENIYELSDQLFKIIKDEYKLFFNKEQIIFLDNLDIKNLYKIINNKKLPRIFYLDNKYYLNDYYNLENIEKLVPFMCFSFLIKNINPLKIGLIEEEIKYLKDKYELDIENIFSSELEVAELLSQGLLNDLPFKVVFKDSDLDIINYLTEESGSKFGLFYASISKEMKKIKKEKDYFNFDDKVDYSNITDIIYDFISKKVR